MKVRLCNVEDYPKFLDLDENQRFKLLDVPRLARLVV